MTEEDLRDKLHDQSAYIDLDDKGNIVLDGRFDTSELEAIISILRERE